MERGTKNRVFRPISWFRRNDVMQDMGRIVTMEDEITRTLRDLLISVIFSYLEHSYSGIICTRPTQRSKFE